MNTQNTQPQIKTLAELVADLSAAEGKFKNGGYKDEDFKSLKLIQASIQKFEEEKQANVKSIVEKINSYGFTLTDIYSVADIKKAGFVKADVSGNPEPEKVRKERGPITKKPSDSDISLFVIKLPKGGRGRGFEYKKGRIYENASNTAKKPEAPYATVSKLLTEKVKSKEDLLKIINPDNKEKATAYLNTPEGKKEVNAIIAFIKDNTLTTDKLKAVV